MCAVNLNMVMLSVNRMRKNMPVSLKKYNVNLLDGSSGSGMDTVLTYTHDVEIYKGYVTISTAYL